VTLQPLNVPADPGRRRFLCAASALAGMLGTPTLAQVGGVASAADQGFDPSAVATDFWARPRTVWLRRPATGEEIRATWWADGRVVQAEYERLCWFLRDESLAKRIESLERAGRPVPASWYPAVGVSYVTLDILYATNGWLEWFGMSRPLVVTGFFRHPVTNAVTEGAARNSRHQVGGAGDIVVPDVPASRVSAFGAWLRAGGVGFYPGKGFTHVDDGRLRRWKG
jgi:uncharacterized protein YcbK (DUF882 family)